ncbi:hypothetical protein [Thermosulfidibacter takaii]|uniref:hypothetical protein n=1 Tax=Thermosulfidibacter takaii TaxID=412593 RepID=UPI000838F56E|nr:hypothetical protein [Thermosulfidibacter takaii]
MGCGCCGKKEREKEKGNVYQELEERDHEVTVEGQKELAEKADSRSVEILEEEITRTQKDQD